MIGCLHQEDKQREYGRTNQYHRQEQQHHHHHHHHHNRTTAVSSSNNSIIITINFNSCTPYSFVLIYNYLSIFYFVRVLRRYLLILFKILVFRFSQLLLRCIVTLIKLYLQSIYAFVIFRMMFIYLIIFYFLSAAN